MGVLPKLDVVTVDHSLGAFLRCVVVSAIEINGSSKTVCRGQSGMLASAPLRFLLRRMKVAVEPTAHVGFHGIARYNHCVDASALLALEYAIVKTRWSCLNLRETHARLVAFRTALPLDNGKIS
jgi:hypothetical protein